LVLPEYTLADTKKETQNPAVTSATRFVSSPMNQQKHFDHEKNKEQCCSIRLQTQDKKQCANRIESHRHLTLVPNPKKPTTVLQRKCQKAC
jgi:hypothetical protein